MKNVLIMASLFFLALRFLTGLDFTPRRVVDENVVEEDRPIRKAKVAKRSIASKGPIQRAPARFSPSPSTPTQYEAPERPESFIDEDDPREASVSPAIAPSSVSNVQYAESSFPGQRRQSEDFRRSREDSSNGSDDDESSLGSTAETKQSAPGIVSSARIGTTNFGPSGGSSSNDTTSSGDSSSDPSISISCSASLGDGTYKNPENIRLTCSTSATIKYCLQQGGGCCDPSASGTTYSGAIPVGNDVDSYCLSFYGSSGSSSSPLVSKNYIFDPDMPQLTATHSKRFYQTTQLSGRSIITSTDFGDPDFAVGQINTLNVDPGVGGHNLTCEQLVDNYATLTPAPIETVVPINMSNFSLTDQIFVNLNLPKLVYGDNFITSFAAHVNYVEKVSCSTTRVVLKDFDYFEAYPAFADAGTNTIREFAGGLTPYGFFEETNLYRGPAGSTAEEQGGQELRVGLFGIFF